MDLDDMTKAKRAYPDVRAYLEEIRRQGRTQNEIAAALGISVSYLSDIKQGRYQPSLDLAIRIAELANVPIESMVKR